MQEKIRQSILFSGDTILLYVSLFIALSARNQEIINSQTWAQHWPIFTYAFVVWLAVFYIVGAYTLSNIKNDLRFYAASVRAMAINMLLSTAFFYVLPQARVAPKTILLLTGVIFFILFIVWRQIAHRWVAIASLKQKVLIIGENALATNLMHLLERNPQYGYTIAAILPHNATESIGNVPDYRDAQQLAHVIDSHHIEMVVLDKKSREFKKLVSNLYQLLDRKLEFMSLDQFHESISKRVSIELVDQFWFLEHVQEGKRRLFDVSKRGVDVIAALIALVVSVVVIPIIGIGILITSKGPIFFTQTRLGKNGKPFTAIKLRTMVCDAEKEGPQFAQKNDPRATAFGRFLRKTRLDELPQLWNILKGDMSFVGPRPERPEFTAQFETDISYYRDRLLVKPGLTGWAQINSPYGNTTETMITKLEYDLYYIKNRTLVLDLTIILRTIRTVVSGGGQ